ncbi:MAG TPA: hypothetical protein VNA14_07830 [Mycobacteriales bacterium]|nr:hypothetical protein [Mycobacteriales bacterium]
MSPPPSPHRGALAAAAYLALVARRPSDEATATVRLPAGTDVAASFARFSRSGDDLLERWDGRALARCVRLADAVVPFTAETAGDSLLLHVTDGARLVEVTFAASSMVEPLPAGWADLIARDTPLAPLHERYAGLRAVRVLDPFVALVHSISAQQVNLRWAATTRHRLASAYGDPVEIGSARLHVLDVDRMAAADVADLRTLQLTTAKARALVDLAAAVADGALDLVGLAALDDAAVVETLVRLRGIGPWTAQWYLARVLGRPVVVAGDLAVRKAVGLLYGEPTQPGPERTLELTAHWGDRALHAQQLVLHALGEGTLSPAGRVPSTR